MRFFKLLGTALLLVYALMALCLWGFQRSLIYQPYYKGHIASPVPAPENFENLDVTTSDGIDLRGWWHRAKEGMPTIVYFHGNADRLPDTRHYHDQLIDRGYGVLLTSYRGYSGHQGTPTEEGLYRDGSAFIEGLMAHGVAQDDIIIYGFSLGSGVATEMAVRYPPKALMLGAPFTSLPNAAAGRYWFVPVKALLKDRYMSEEKIGRVTAPILIINGKNDGIFPPTQGQHLSEIATASKDVTFKTFPGTHDGFYDHGARDFLTQWLMARFGQK